MKKRGKNQRLGLVMLVLMFTTLIYHFSRTSNPTRLGTRTASKDEGSPSLIRAHQRAWF